MSMLSSVDQIVDILLIYHKCPLFSGKCPRTRFARFTTFLISGLSQKIIGLFRTNNLATLNYCLNPNSTNSSVQQNLRLDYILTERSTHHPPPTTTNYLLLLLTAKASQAGRLYNYTVIASHAIRLYYNRLTLMFSR
jgi:hypothetical protein